jgi:hypothetical protein
MVVLPFSSVLSAQETVKSASIELEVKDTSGAVLQNALVQILPLSNTLGKNLTTGNDGKLSLDVSPGSYDVSVAQVGFLPTKKHIEVQPGAPQTITIFLPVGSCPPCGPCLEITGKPRFTASFPLMCYASSPDGRYQIIGVNSDAEPHHTIYWEDMVHETWRKLLTYDQRVDLLWNANSKLLAVTDFVGTESSRCTIYSVDESIPPIQVLDLLCSKLPKSEQKRLKSLLANHHVYVEASAWNGLTELQLKVSGYGDANPAGFSEIYDVQLQPRKR